MSEIVISFEVESNNDVKVTNKDNNKSFTISYQNKYISASSIYNLLSYKTGCKYQLEEFFVKEGTDEKAEHFLKEVVSIFRKICDEVTLLKIKDSNEDICDISLLDEDSNEDFPF